MALTLEDVLARRTRLLLEDRARNEQIAAEVAILMARELDWSIEHMHVQVQQYSALVAYQLQMENQQLVYHIS
jgi:glycerol-3-phosphate dehydrogenase